MAWCASWPTWDKGLLDAVDATVIRGRIERCTRRLRDDHVNAQVRVIDSDASGGGDPLP